MTHTVNFKYDNYSISANWTGKWVTDTATNKKFREVKITKNVPKNYYGLREGTYIKTIYFDKFYRIDEALCNLYMRNKFKDNSKFEISHYDDSYTVRTNVTYKGILIGG
jgi:hypothetical protein